MKTISIVIPCYNEADCIKMVYNELNKKFFQPAQPVPDAGHICG